MNTIIKMVEPCSLLADIGCDHGYVCIQTVKNGQVEAAIASDVAEGPLQFARENITAAGLEGRITTVLADGLSGIPEDVYLNCIVMTGIGGLLMRRILGALQQDRGSMSAGNIDSDAMNTGTAGNTDPRFANLSQLVLGPQSDIDAVRHFLIDELHFPIVRELTVFDDGKYYTLLDVRPGSEAETSSGNSSYTESEYLYGKNIDPSTKEVYLAYLEQQKQILTDAYHGALRGCSFGAAQAISVLKHRMALVDEAMAAVKRKVCSD